MSHEDIQPVDPRGELRLPARAAPAPRSFRELARWQRDALEREQSRLSSEVHDQIGQALTGLKMDVAMLRARIGALQGGVVPPALSDTLTSMSTLIDETIGVARGISRRLRPSLLDDFGLVAALEWYAMDYQRRTAARCTVVCDDDDLILSAAVTTTAYRIVTQLLDVMARKSGNSVVSLRVARGAGTLQMTLVDHTPATGDAPEAGDASLMGPRHRRSLTVLDAVERAKDAGGRVRIARERARGGTAVVVTLPLLLQAPPQPHLEDRSI